MKLPRQYRLGKAAEVAERLTSVLARARLPLESLAIDKQKLAESLVAGWGQANATVLEHSLGSASGVAVVHYLKWDTEMLGIQCARLSHFSVIGEQFSQDFADVAEALAESVVAWAIENEIDLLDHKLDTRDLFNARFLEQVGFHSVDVLVTMASKTSGLDPNVQFDLMRDGELQTLKDISRDAFGDLDAIQDRFFLEPSIPHENANRLFEEWFVNSHGKHVSGTGAIGVARQEEVAIGYVALEQLDNEIYDGVWYDSLNAIAAEHRGKGVYKQLIQGAHAYVGRSGGTTLITKTQASNARVINTWLHMGANVLESSISFHWTRDQS